MKVFPGSYIFEYKATHGIPFEITLQHVLSKGYTIEWVSFIETARKNKWWDYQTIESISYALEDVLYDKDVVDAYIQRMKLYILTNPHPEII